MRRLVFESGWQRRPRVLHVCLRAVQHYDDGPRPCTPTAPSETGDSFYFAHVEIDSLEQPEISISARVVGLSRRPHARVGAMIRASGEDLETAPYAAVLLTNKTRSLLAPPHSDSF